MGKFSNFVNQYSKTNTRRVYTTAVHGFLCFIYDMERDRKITLETYEELADRYLSEERDYSQDVIGFALSQSNSPPKTVRTYIAAVKEFLIFSEIEIREMDLRKIKKKMPKGGAATIEKILDAETVKAILFQCTLMMRAIILLLVSSGMRIGEVLTLEMADIDVSRLNNIGVIEVRGMTARGDGAKGGYQRYCFCSVEAAEAIRAWLLKRDQYMIEAQNKGKGIGQTRNPADTRLFPVSSTTVGDAWLIALQAAGLVSRDSMTNRLQIHVHMARKFFSSQLRLAVPSEIVEGLMGHSGYLSDSYRRYTRAQVEEFYRKGEPYVTIQMTDEIRELRTTTEKKMQAHSEILENVVQRNLNMERKMQDQAHEIQKLRNLTETLQKVMMVENPE